jgi:hypothetical protein
MFCNHVHRHVCTANQGGFQKKFKFLSKKKAFGLQPCLSVICLQSFVPGSASAVHYLRPTGVMRDFPFIANEVHLIVMVSLSESAGFVL